MLKFTSARGKMEILSAICTTKYFVRFCSLKRHVETVHKDNEKLSYKCNNCHNIYERENPLKG